MEAQRIFMPQPSTKLLEYTKANAQTASSAQTADSALNRRQTASGIRLFEQKFVDGLTPGLTTPSFCG